MNLSFGTYLVQTTYQARIYSPRQYYVAQLLKAFKLFPCNMGKFYTCNVERLHACNRLGDEKQVSLWRTHFFIVSNAFQGAKAVIFNGRPGIELANLSRNQVDDIYIAVSAREILDPRNGERFTLDRDIVFASVEK